MSKGQDAKKGSKKEPKKTKKEKGRDWNWGKSHTR